ncbi:MAG: protein nirF [Proteobacteria bacterium]|nr:protein nirF [Pseudomonadota bacterium]
MKRRAFVSGAAASAVALPLLGGCAATPSIQPADPVGSGDLGLVVERASGSLAVVNTSRPAVLGRIEGLGDLSHASIVYARDGARGFVFGRDGALTRVNLLTRRIEARVQQAGNSIGGAISQDGTLVAAQNYQPGGVKVFDARTLALVADIPALDAQGKRSRVVGLADLPGRRFIYSLFDADAICIADLSDPQSPRVTRLDGIGRQPYDALLTPDGRHYIAGLFGEDGLALVDLWAERPQVQRVLGGYGRGQQPLPVYKMPHLRGWAVAGREAWLPAIGHHEVLVADTTSWAEVGRVAVAGQPVFVMAQPDGRRVWVNFALPDYHKVQVIDVPTRRVVHGFEPGRAVLHLEFTPRGEAVWISARDDNRVLVVDTASWRTLATLDVRSPSGIFFTARAARVGL